MKWNKLYINSESNSLSPRGSGQNIALLRQLTDHTTANFSEFEYRIKSLPIPTGKLYITNPENEGLAYDDSLLNSQQEPIQYDLISCDLWFYVFSS